MDRADPSHQYPLVPTDLSRRLQVIGAGLSRTGTSSFFRAVEILLDGPSCHAGSIVLKREESYIKKWISILNPTTKVAVDNFFGYFLVGLVLLFERLPTSKTEEIDVKKTLKELLDGYVATADAASIFFVGEIAEVYPEAKVICMARDPEKWFASYKSLIKSHNSFWGNILTFIRPTNRLYISWMSGIVERRQHIYPPGKDDPFVVGPEFMRIHEDYLRRVVPAERLFFYDIKDGWEPLCKILDCPVPDFPFPHEYEAKDMAAGHAEFREKGKKEWIRVLKLPVLGIIVGVLGWLCTLKLFS